MPIAAKRFSFLDNETNVPVSNFLTNASSDILNSPQFDALAITNQMQSLANAGKISDIGSLLSKVNLTGSIGLSRITKDFFSSITSLTGIGNDTYNSMAENIFPDPTMRNYFNQVGIKCKATILTGLGDCKRRKSFAILNNKKIFTNNKSCNIYGFANLINKLTGGLYNPNLFNECALIRLVAGISIRGFDLGLPNVFSSISGQIINKHLLAQVGASVLGSVANSRNMNAVIDVAGSSVGGMIKSINPNITSLIMNNYRIPSEIRQNQIPEFQNSFSNAMTNLDPYWNTGQLPYTNSLIPSIASFDSNNSDLKNAYQCCMYDSNEAVPSEDDDPPEPDYNSSINTALNLNEFDTEDAMRRDFTAGLPDLEPVTHSTVPFESDW